MPPTTRSKAIRVWVQMTIATDCNQLVKWAVEDMHVSSKSLESYNTIL